MAKGTTLVPTDQAMATLKQIAQALPVRDEDDDIDARIVGQILSSGSMEEALTPKSAPSLGDLAGIPFKITDVARVDGGQNQDTGFYLLVGVRLQDGTEGVYATGAARIMATIMYGWSNGELDNFEYTVLEVASKKNPGRFIQYLVKSDHF